MKSLKENVVSIFYDIINYYDMIVYEENEYALKLQNQHCEIAIANHRGELYFHFTTQHTMNHIHSFYWAAINHRYDYKQMIPMSISPDITGYDSTLFGLCYQKMLCSLFCKDIISGKVTSAQIDHYINSVDEISREYNAFCSSFQS
jgi:hypothetical protein